MENNEDKIIAIRQNAKAELEQLKTIEDGMEHLNKLKGIEAWVKAQKLDAELHSLVLEQELRAKRIVGKLLKEGRDSGEILKLGENKEHRDHKNMDVPTGNIHKKTLADLGLNPKQSATFQKIASIPEEVFEEHIAEAKAEVDTAVKKLTTTGAVKLAEQLAGGKSDVDRVREIAAKVELEDRIREVLKEINSWPKLYRMKIKQGIK